jgi:hypothetical protein
MVSSALTWFFALPLQGEINQGAIVLPTTFLAMGSMLALAFRDCQFRKT